MRGLLKNRKELSRLSKKIKDCGGTIFPYEVTSNAWIFEVKTCVKWLLEQFGLWCHVERGEHIVSTASTINGGELSWWSTQISRVIKNCNPRAIDPRIGEKMFGECGTKNVRPPYNCFPLKICMAKDNGARYDQHLAIFFTI